MMFDTPREPRTCACCGVVIIKSDSDNPDYVRLHFTVEHSTAVVPISFCHACADQDWTLERVAQLDEQCQWMHNRHGNPRFALPHLVNIAHGYPPQTWRDIDALKVAL